MGHFIQMLETVFPVVDSKEYNLMNFSVDVNWELAHESEFDRI